MAANAAVFVYTQRTAPSLSVTAAENCWVLLNVFWLFSEYRPEIGWFLTTAEIILAFNVAFLAIEVGSARFRRGVAAELTARIRRLRGDQR